MSSPKQICSSAIPKQGGGRELKKINARQTSTHKQPYDSKPAFVHEGRKKDQIRKQISLFQASNGFLKTMEGKNYFMHRWGKKALPSVL